MEPQIPNPNFIQYQPTDNITANSTPSQTTNFQQTKKPKRFGPVITILIIVFVLMAIVIYFVASKTEIINPEKSSANIQNVSNQQTIENQTEQTGTVEPISNNNDDLQSLQADLESSINGLEDQNI